VADTDRREKNKKLHYKSKLYSLSYILSSFILVFFFFIYVPVPVFFVPVGKVRLLLFFSSLLFCHFLSGFFLSSFPYIRGGGIVGGW